jgi:hypothetical protein
VTEHSDLIRTGDGPPEFQTRVVFGYRHGVHAISNFYSSSLTSGVTNEKSSLGNSSSSSRGASI